MSRFFNSAERRQRQDFLNDYYKKALIDLTSKLENSRQHFEIIEHWEQIKNALRWVNEESPEVEEFYKALEREMSHISKLIGPLSLFACNKTFKEIAKYLTKWQAKQEKSKKRKRKKKNGGERVIALPAIPVPERQALTAAEFERKEWELKNLLALADNFFKVYSFQETIDLHDDKSFAIWWERAAELIKFHQQHPEFDISSLIEKLQVFRYNLIAPQGFNPSPSLEKSLREIQLFLANKGDFWWHTSEVVPAAAQAATLRLLSEEED